MRNIGRIVVTIEKLNLSTPDIVDDNVASIAALFPGVVTEGKDKDGKLTRVIDFDALKQELSNNIVEGPQERYRLDWPGKRAAMLTANTPITKTLRPVREESVNFDVTQNLFIEGDNLEALKLLQETYLGKVKMIYIDPPYNTGKDFIYKDNFTRNKSEYLEGSDQVDEDGGRLVANTETNGRYHSDWLSMMYPRLKLARNLMRDDGVIFISIDDNESQNLKALCDEVLGENNYRNMIAVRRGVKNVQVQFDDISDLASGHEYVLCYTKDGSARLPKLAHMSETNHAGKWDTFWRGTDRPTMRYELFGNKPDKGQWRWKEEKTDLARKNYKEYLASGNGITLDDYYLDELQSTNTKLDFVRLNDDDVIQYYVPPRNYKIISDNWMDVSTKGNFVGFDTEKHINLMRRMVDWVTDREDIVVDFFAGSGTTGHAVIESNAADGGNRRFILVQVGQQIDHPEFDNLVDFSKERIRLAGNKIAEKNVDQLATVDVGFRVLKIDTSNMNDVNSVPSTLVQNDLLSQVKHIKPLRTDEDLLFQVMLNQGVDLTLPILNEKIAGKPVYFVGGDALAACFDKDITEEVVKAMAERKPLYAIFRDDGFASDDTKINTAQLFKQMTDEHTRVKVI